MSIKCNVKLFVQSWRTASRPKKIITALIGSILFLQITLVILQCGYSVTKTLLAKSKVTHVRLSVEQQADEEFYAMVDALQQNGLIDSEVGNSKYDVCYISEDDAGWMAYNYYQICYLRYVKGYTTSASKNDLNRVAHANQNLFGETIDKSFGDEAYPCRIAEYQFKESLRYITSKSQNDNRSECDAPSSIKGLHSIAGASGGIVIRKIWGDSVPSQNGNVSQSEIWLSRERAYYREDLGCGLNLLFCINLRPNAVLNGSNKYDPYTSLE